MEEQQTYYIILASFLMPLLLSGILIWFVINYQKRKNQYEIETKERQLKEQQLIIEKQTALQAERNRIAAEMHDDLGGGLTTIKFISQRALKNIKNSEDQKLLEKISNQSSDLVNNMSEIIWAMNSGFDNLSDLTGYIRRYAKLYLSEFNIELDFDLNGDTKGIEVSGEKRRHIFLIIKEALHNVVKHSKATQVEMKIAVKEQLTISIKDNGAGFSVDQKTFGNGLSNMKKRIETLGGIMNISSDNGTQLTLNVPIRNKKL